MKKSAFTMVELIFVIIIIGILAATALPKFNNTVDNAKANSELLAMNGLDGSIVAKRNFRQQDHKDNNVTWNDRPLTEFITGTARAPEYQRINDSKGVLKAIMKKGDKFKIIGFVPDIGISYLHATSSKDILLITGPASDSKNGLKYPNDAQNSDIEGKPDRNDFWVFNPNIYDVNVTAVYGSSLMGSSIISAKSIGLVDVNGTQPIRSSTSSAAYFNRIRIYKYKGTTNTSSPTYPYIVK